MIKFKYGSLEGLGVISDRWEAWQLSPNGVWHEINAADAATKAKILTESEFQRIFGPVPPLPKGAFQILS